MTIDLQEEPLCASVEARKAEVLIEALPWISRFYGKTVVVKYGGSAMEDPALRASVIEDLTLMAYLGIRLVVVHGGGKAISALMERLRLPVSFRDGLRVTDDAAMEAVSMALVGQVNQGLVGAMNAFGQVAVGVTGSDGCTLKGEPVSAELGRVGTVTSVNTHLISCLMDEGYVPVVAGVAMGADGQLNVNADLVASEVAGALEADKLVFMTDVDGIYLDYPACERLVSCLTTDEAARLAASGELTGGMLPKVEAATRAIEAGVGRVHVLNGTFPHALLLEVFTDRGVGTMFLPAGEGSQRDGASAPPEP